MHLDEEQLQRLIHGELPTTADTPLHAHLAQCDDCRGRVETARRDDARVNELLGSLDAPPRVAATRVTVEDVVARARRRDVPWMHVAAMLLLTVGVAGVAYAVPGSPVRRWIDGLVERTSDATPATPPAAQTPQPRADSAVAGVAVAPGARLVIQFRAYQSAGQVRVSLTDSADVIVRAPSGAGEFVSDVDRLVIENRGSGASFDVLIPRSAVRVEIRAGVDRLLLKERARIEASVSPDARGVYAIPLSQPARPSQKSP